MVNKFFGGRWWRFVAGLILCVVGGMVLRQALDSNSISLLLRGVIVLYAGGVFAGNFLTKPYSE